VGAGKSCGPRYRPRASPLTSSRPQKVMHGTADSDVNGSLLGPSSPPGGLVAACRKTPAMEENTENDVTIETIVARNRNRLRDGSLARYQVGCGQHCRLCRPLGRLSRSCLSESHGSCLLPGGVAGGYIYSFSIGIRTRSRWRP